MTIENAVYVCFGIFIGILACIIISGIANKPLEKPKEAPVYRYFIAYTFGNNGRGNIEITRMTPILCHNDLNPICEIIMTSVKEQVRKEHPNLTENNIVNQVQKIIITNWKQY